MKAKCLADSDVRFRFPPEMFEDASTMQRARAEDFRLLLSRFNPLWWIWRFAGGVIYVALWHIADARKALNQYS